MMRMIVLRDQSFNSRTPGGVRHLLPHLIHNQDMFQFTHPGRGATDELHGEFRAGKVSIHAPREGCDHFRERPLYW